MRHADRVRQLVADEVPLAADLSTIHVEVNGLLEIDVIGMVMITQICVLQFGCWNVVPLLFGAASTKAMVGAPALAPVSVE